MIFFSSQKAYLALSRRSVQACIPGVSAEKALFKEFGFAIDEGEAVAAVIGDSLAAALDWIDLTLGRRRLVDIHWVVSDPWAHHRLFRVDRLPRGRKARDELVRWRFGQELPELMEGLKVSWMTVPGQAGSELVYSTALESGLYEALCKPCLDRGWPVRGMVTLYHGLESVNGHVSVWSAPMSLVVTEEYWMSWRTGAQGQPVIRSRWFQDDPQAEVLLRDIARGINEEGCESIRLCCSEPGNNTCQKVVNALSLPESAVSVTPLFSVSQLGNPPVSLARSLLAVAGGWQ